MLQNLLLTDGECVGIRTTRPRGAVKMGMLLEGYELRLYEVWWIGVLLYRHVDVDLWLKMRKYVGYILFQTWDTFV